MDIMTTARLRPWLRALLLLTALLAGRLARAQATLNYAEYFVDADPGVGLGTRVAFPAAAAVQDHTFAPNLTGVAAGIHTLYLRVHSQNGASGRWSHSFARSFMKLNATASSGGAAPNLIAAEYFIDADPGVGQGTALAVPASTSIDQTYMLNLAAVTPGVHTINLRTKDANGRWSQTFQRSFMKMNATASSGGPAPNLTAAEYFIDTDPGVGQGTALAVPAGTSMDQTYPLDLSALSSGVHTMYLRVRDASGRWSHSFSRSFMKLAPPPPGGNTAPNITRAEYFIDADPGVGQGSASAVTPGSTIDQTQLLNLSAVTPGVHMMSVRVMDQNRRWSHSFSRSFLKLAPTTSGSTAPNLTAAEYFIDADPGVGQGTALTVTPGTSMDQVYSLNLTSLAPGIHTLHTRVRDASGRWSHNFMRPFLKLAPPAGARPLITKIRYRVTQGSTVVQGPDEYVLPVASRAADIDETFSPQLCLTAAGSYVMNMTAVDANGRAAIEYSRTFTVNTPTKFQPMLTPAIAACTGQTVTLSSAAAGTGASYLWNTGASTQSISVTTPGTYYVDVTSSAGCVGSDTTRVSFTPSPVVALADTTAVPCGGSSALLDAGAGFASYLWSTGATTQTITATTPGTYSVTVGTGSGGCSASGSTVVLMPNAVIQAVSQTVCAGQSRTLTLATPTNGSIRWSTGATTSSITVSPTVTTTYTATVRVGSHSCPASVTLTVVPTNLTVTGPSAPICPSQSTILTASAGTPLPGDYALRFDGSNDNASIPNTAAYNLSTALTMEAWIRPSGGGPSVQDVVCKSSNSQNTGYIFPRTDNRWGHLALWLNIGGSWNVYTTPYTANIGTWHHAAATYDGSNVRIFIDGVQVFSAPRSGAVSINTNPLTLGVQPGFGENYSGDLDEVRVWNVSRTPAQIQADYRRSLPGSTPGLVASFALNEGSGLTTADAVAGNNATLNNGTAWIASDVNSNGGYTYSWSPATNLSASTGASVTATPTVTTTYTVTGTNGSCTSTGQVTVTVNPDPIVAANPSTVATGQTTTLSVSNPQAGTTYSWSGPGLQTSTGTSVSAVPTAVGSAQYTVTATLTAAGCSRSGQTTVTVTTAPCPAPTNLLAGSISQTGAQLTFTAAAGATNYALSYTPQGGSNQTQTVTGSPVNLTGLTPGVSYAVSLTTNCSGSPSAAATTSFTTSAPPAVTLAPIAPVCISVGSFALSGGSPAGGSYSGPGVSSGQFDPTTAGAGTHTITYSYSINGWTGTATQPLTVRALPTVTLAAFAPVCEGAATFTLSGGSPAGGTYSGVGVSGGQFNPTAAGVGTHGLSYAYTDGNGCASVAFRSLTVLPTPTLAAADTIVCAGQPTTLTVSNAGAGATYAWSTGASTASILVSPLVRTAYTVTVTNAAGCTYSRRQVISTNPFSAAPGLVGQMQPVDNSAGLSLPITFSWSPATTTTVYDLYIWAASGSQPGTPTVSGLTTLQYSYNGNLPYGANYRWRVVARNPCGSTAGPVFAFGLRQLPDLRVSFIQNPDTVYAGQTMQMSWNVTNTGAGSTLAQQWRDEVWLSQDSVFNAGTAIRVGDWGNTTFLQPNATYITNATFTVPYSQAGYYYVFVRANSNGALLETDLSNNRRRAADRTLMIVPETPDFSVENFVSPPDPSVGYTDVTMRYRVYNRGTVTATLPRYDEFFISPDTILNISQNTGRLALGPNAISLGRQRVTDTLLANGFYARTVTVRVPHTEYGTRYFYAYSDTDNTIFETASTNNVNRPVPVEIILRPPADLTPTVLTAPANMLAGTTATVAWEVRNIGNNPPVVEERYWSDQFWLSPTATFDPLTAIAVGSASMFDGQLLGVGQSYTRNVSLNIPNGLSGTYYVFGMADYVANSTRGNVFEYLSEGNNMRRSGLVNVTLTYADLQPTAFTGPAAIDAFQTVTVNYSVRNNNTAVGPATGTWTDAVWMVTPGGTIQSNSVWCGPVATITRSGPLALGASYSGAISFNIPRPIAPGSYEFIIRTNQGNTVYEYTFGNNNERRYAFTYRYSDDLRLTALSTTGTAFSGQTINVNWSVDNQGAFRTLATNWVDQFYLSTDAVLDAGDLSLAGVVRSGDLAVGSSYNGSATVRLPHGLQGNFFVLGKTGVPGSCGGCDPNCSTLLVDTNLANNFRTTALPITLTPPCDLIPTAYTLPTDVVAGQQVTIPFTIRNQGVGATLEGNWDDGIYLSTSPSVNGSVVRIGTYRHPGTLAAGQSYSGTVTATIPAYLSGNYYIFLVTDITPGANGYYPGQLWGGAVQYGTVYEHQQEVNNVVQSSILIRVPLPADLIVTSVTVPASRKLGETMTVHYQVKNQGVNTAVGQVKDGLYLSQDATVDGAVDQLFATKTQNLTIAPNQTVNGVVRSHLQGIMPGSYHGLMATNLFNDIYEGGVSSPAANNNVTDANNPLALGVNVLPLRTPTSFPLMLDSVVYYKVSPSANKDMVLTLTSNHSLGQNEMYVAYNRVPTPADYDFIYLNQVSTAQEILVPTTGAGDYYVLVKTPYQYPSLQTATLYADTLGFQVRSIAANRVGRGRVTTQVLGAGFRRLRTGPAGWPATRFFLTKGSDPSIRAEAQVLRYRNSTEVTLRWRLDTLSVGLYNVVADNNGTRVQLTDGLTIEPTRALNVDFATIIPQTIRAGANGNWTYFLQNNSNIDVPYWEFQYDLPPGLNPVITHTPNVRKKSDFHAGAQSATPRNRLDDGLTEVLPFVAQDLRPDEIIQVNLRLTANLGVGQQLPVVWNQAALTEEWYTRQTLDHIARYRAAVLAAPASYPAGVATLAANATAWADSLTRYYTRLGLVDTTWLRLHPGTGYTARSVDISIPGGMCGTTGVTECVRPFRPNPFDANLYPAALVGCADSIVFTYKGRGLSCTLVVGSADPNLIAGPAGSGARKMVGAQQNLSYQVQFENDPALATAPAQVVRVTVPLSAAFDAQQFRLGSFGWAERSFPVPANSSSYTAMLDMPDSLGYDVRVLGTVDVVGRRLVWQFETIDPNTGVAPLDPNKGFLALNDSTGRGQGFLNYTIKASPTALTGDTLAAQATIVFDVNPPIPTNRWKNVLDAVAPSSQLAALPANQPGATVALSWTAQDDAGGSGLRSYDLYASQDGGAFQPVATNLTATSYAFTGQLGSRYDFFTLATDTTDNQEAMKLVGDTFTTLAAPVAYVWTGATSTDWNTTTNWSTSLVPTSTSAVSIPAGAPRYPLSAAGTLSAFDLTLAAGATLTLSGGTLDVKGSFVNHGTFAQAGGTVTLTGATAQTVGGTATTTFHDLTVGSAGASLSGGPVRVRRVLTLTGNLAADSRLTLLSDATGTAMVVNNGGVATGNATVQRFISPAQNAGLGYRHLAAAVAGATVADLHGPAGAAPLVNANYNTAANPYAVNPFPTVFGYNEQRITTASTLTNDFAFGWQSPNLADNLGAGQAFTVNLAPTTVSLTGTLRTGSHSVALSRGATANSGWQLLGNPYPAPLNWDHLARPAGLDDALYVFRSTSQYGGSYTSYVNGVGPAGANMVASGQGFFARVSSGTPTLTFTDAARETSYSNPALFRGTASDPRPMLELAVAPAGNSSLSDVLYVYQEAGASMGFDSRYDAMKVLLNAGQQPTLYQQAGPASLSIQGLPVLTQSVALPLGVNAPAAGTFAFTPQRLANFPASTGVYLEDRTTGTLHNLRTGAYSATLPAGLHTSRFILHLNPQGPLATTASLSSAVELQLYPNPATGQASVQVVATGPAKAIGKAQLEVFNALGQRVYQAAQLLATADGLRVKVPTAGLAAGMYTVRLTTASGVLTRKLLIN
jgi:hypothetical protein